MSNYKALVLKGKEEKASLSFLNYLITNHLNNFSFSSLNVQLNRELSLDLDEIEKRFLAHEGGYCFEHNKIFYALLKELGFSVKSSFARVLLNREIEVAKTHRFNIVSLENKRYIVDVGFGAYSPSSAIEISSEATLATNGFIYNVVNKNEILHFNILKERSNFVLYSFEEHTYNEKDYEVSHFYSHKHKEANFVKNLVISLHKEGKIHSLYNLDYKILDEKEECISSQSQLSEILEGIFGVSLTCKEAELLYTKLTANAS